MCIAQGSVRNMETVHVVSLISLTFRRVDDPVRDYHDTRCF